MNKNKAQTAATLILATFKLVGYPLESFEVVADCRLAAVVGTRWECCVSPPGGDPSAKPVQLFSFRTPGTNPAATVPEGSRNLETLFWRRRRICL